MAKKKVILTIVIMALIMFVIVFATVAWFIVNREVNTNDIIITAEAGNSIDVSIEDGPNADKRYGAVANLDLGGRGQTAMVTGDGLNLYRAAHQDEITGEPTSLTVAEPTTVSNGIVIAAGDFIQFNLTFRTSIKMRVFLSKEAYVLPIDKTPSQLYNIANDYIAGAVRVSFSTKDPQTQEEKLSFVWAPNSNYNLDYNGTDYSFNESGAPEDKYYYYDAQGYKHEFTPEQLALKEFVAGDILTDTVMANNTKEVAQCYPEEGVSYAYETVTVRIWIEGTDREARQPLGGGKFKVYLKFFGLNKADAVASKTARLEQISTPGILGAPNSEIIGLNYLPSISGQVLFSRNGRTWETYIGDYDLGIYKDNLGPAFTGHEYLCLKYPETETEFETKVKILRFYKLPGGAAPPAIADDGTNKITGVGGINDELMEISYNNGRAWVSYSSSLEFHGLISVWLRIKETATTYASASVELNFTKNIPSPPSNLKVNKTEKYISGVIYWSMEISVGNDQNYVMLQNKTEMIDILENYYYEHGGKFYVYIRYKETELLAASAPAIIDFDAYS